MPGPGLPDKGRRPAGRRQGTRTRGPGPGPGDQADGGHSAVRGVRIPLSPRRARGPRASARRVGAVARHRAGQHRPGARAGTVGICCSRASLPAMPTATSSTPPGPDGSPGRSGLPCASLRSTRPGSTTMRDSARTATLHTATSIGTSSTLGTGTAPRARQEPGPALVAVTSRSLETLDAAQSLCGFL
jgi:hypothetical protein